MREQKPREGEQLASRHTAGQSQSQSKIREALYTPQSTSLQVLCFWHSATRSFEGFFSLLYTLTEKRLRCESSNIFLLLSKITEGKTNSILFAS